MSQAYVIISLPMRTVTSLPPIQPAKLTQLKEPIDNPNWLYEIKHDGFRGMLYVDEGEAWIMKAIPLQAVCFALRGTGQSTEGQACDS